MVAPIPHPSRFWTANKAACRRISREGTSAVSCPRTALAITRLRLWARPSSSRLRQWRPASPWPKDGLIQTSPSRTWTGQVGTSSGWRTFLLNHAEAIASIDLFVVPTISFRLLYGMLVLAHGRRHILSLAVTAHPSAEW